MNLLFDSKPRTYMQPSNRAETSYSFYDRSGQPVFRKIREMLERWIGRLPFEHRTRFVSRMKHKGAGSQTEEDRFNAAFFELYVHEFLTGASSNVVVEPEFGSLTPDFGAMERNLPYVVEVTDLNVTKHTDLESDWKEMRAFDALDEIKSDHFTLWAKTEGKLATDVPLKPLVRQFRELVNDADYEEILLESKTNGFFSERIPKSTFAHDGWRVTGTLMPRNNPAALRKTGFVASVSRGVGTIDDIGKLREKLRDKARFYKDVGNLIIAVRADWTVDRVSESLFGREMLVLEHMIGPTGSLEITNQHQERRNDGLWFGDKGPRYENVIGVVVFHGVHPGSVAKSRARFYANPYVDVPFPAWATELPHARYSPSGGIDMVGGCDPATFMSDYVEFESPW